MNLFAKIVGSWKPSTIFAKNFILDVWEGSKYVSGNNISTWNYMSTKIAICIS